jgi:hypothetical protein
MAALRLAEYRVEMDGGDMETARRASAEMMAQAQVLADKTSKGVTKTIDIRGMIEEMRWQDGQLVLRLAAAPEGSLRPELVMNTLFRHTGVFGYRVVRTGLFACGRDGAADLLRFCQSV